MRTLTLGNTHAQHTPLHLLQVSLAGARAETAEAREREQAHHAACVQLERQVEAAAAAARQQAARLEQLERAVRGHAVDGIHTATGEQAVGGA